MRLTKEARMLSTEVHLLVNKSTGMVENGSKNKYYLNRLKDLKQRQKKDKFEIQSVRIK